MFTSFEEIMDFLKAKNFQKRIDNLSKKYKDKKIILYGAGLFFNVINKNYDLSKLNIVGLVDLKFLDAQEYQGYKAYNTDYFCNKDFDVVLISMIEPDVAEDFFEEILFPEYGKFKFEPIMQFSFIDRIKMLFK